MTEAQKATLELILRRVSSRKMRVGDAMLEIEIFIDKIEDGWKTIFQRELAQARKETERRVCFGIIDNPGETPQHCSGCRVG